MKQVQIFYELIIFKWIYYNKEKAQLHVQQPSKYEKPVQF
jgi:hypothetical protein